MKCTKRNQFLISEKVVEVYPKKVINLLDDIARMSGEFL